MTVQADADVPGDDLITRIKEVTVINAEIREGLAEARAPGTVARKKTAEDKPAD